MKSIEQALFESEQRIHRAEEDRRKEEAKAKKRYSRRCYKMGERVLSVFPHLAECTEEEALLELQRLLSNVMPSEV